MTALPHDTEAASVFRPESLLREARRQRGLAPVAVPRICILDPDGDLAAFAARQLGAVRMEGWACYHSELLVCDLGPSGRVGIVPKAVGAPYAVLVAELLFASGCRLLVSLASAGQISEAAAPPCFVLLDRALRDEGTSAHYLPPGDEVAADGALMDLVAPALRTIDPAMRIGGSWTTDAPFRETEAAIGAARARGALVVEMEAAGLYAFARACGRDVVCLAHVTNRLGQEGDFDKGVAEGAAEAIALIEGLVAAWGSRPNVMTAAAT